MARPEKIEMSELLRRATDLFWDRGCDGVSTRDLEAALGLRAPALYRRFPSKHALLARCLDDYVERVLDRRVRYHLEGTEDPVAGLYAFFTSSLDTFPKAPGRRGCLLANTAAHAEAALPEIQAAIARGWERVESAMRQCVVRAQELGVVDRSFDADALARALFLSLQGLLTLTRASTKDLRPAIDATFQLLGSSAPEGRNVNTSPGSRARPRSRRRND